MVRRRASTPLTAPYSWRLKPERVLGVEHGAHVVRRRASTPLTAPYTGFASRLLKRDFDDDGIRVLWEEICECGILGYIGLVRRYAARGSGRHRRDPTAGGPIRTDSSHSLFLLWVAADWWRIDVTTVREDT